MNSHPVKLLDRVRNKIRLEHYSIRTIQDLLRHKDVSTIMIYTHVLNKGGRAVRSPFDKNHQGRSEGDALGSHLKCVLNVDCEYLLFRM